LTEGVKLKICVNIDMSEE